MTSVSPPTNSHNFSLPSHLQWNEDAHTAVVRRQRSTMDPPPPHHNRRDLASESMDRREIQMRLESTLDPEKNSETKAEAKDVEEPPIKKSKIVLKIPCSRKRGEDISIPIQTLPPEVEKKAEGDERIKEETKVWNLRPRNSIRRPVAADEGVPDRENCKKKKKEKKKTLSICISLTKEEIEEDIFAMLGSKPAKRPKKRSRALQNQLDNLFPGLGLVSISAESYR